MINPKISLICILLAFIPALVYLWYFLKKDPEPKRLVIKTFLMGCFSVIPLAIIQYFMSTFPDYDVYNIIGNSFTNHYAIAISTFIFVGFSEEYLKHWVVKIADDKERAFRKVVDGIELSIIAALGFSFIEHIVYFVSVYHTEGTGELIKVFIFRSIFTTLAHACFSGIYGYYYGRSHFLKSKIKKDLMVMRGLLSAMILHAIYNFVLELGMVYIMIPFLIMEFTFILYEFKQSRNREILLSK